MKVVVYNFENNLKEAFIQMNLKWISEMFKVEEVHSDCHYGHEDKVSCLRVKPPSGG